MAHDQISILAHREESPSLLILKHCDMYCTRVNEKKRGGPHEKSRQIPPDKKHSASPEIDEKS